MLMIVLMRLQTAPDGLLTKKSLKDYNLTNHQFDKQSRKDYSLPEN